jgi:mRNA interferase RelE/StbE
MVLFKIDWKKSSIKDLYRVHQSYIKRIVKSVEELVEDPLPAQSKKIKDSERSYRIRVGDYRIVY